MPVYVALLRAVNVGGTGKLPMAELKALCAGAGFADVQTYIASGNVVFRSALTAGKVKAALETSVSAYLDKPSTVLVRTAAEMAAIVRANPFQQALPNLTYAHLLDHGAPASALRELKNQTDEQVRLGRREIYVYYPSGMGQSKLVIPAAKAGTARNMNTLDKLAAMAGALN